MVTIVTAVDLTLNGISNSGRVNWRQKRKSKLVHGYTIHTDVYRHTPNTVSNGNNGLLCEGSGRTVLRSRPTAKTSGHCSSEDHIILCLLYMLFMYRLLCT